MLIIKNTLICLSLLFSSVVHAAFEGQSSTSVDIAIIGSGPAGLGCGIVAVKKGLRPLIFTGGAPGGTIIYKSAEVKNWPGVKNKTGKEITDELQEHARHVGVGFSSDYITDISSHDGVFILKSASGTSFVAKTVVVATGSSAQRLGVPGESTFWGKGVAFRLGREERYKRVVVIGSGDDAVEKALRAASQAEEVILLARGNSLKAHPESIVELSNTPHINVHYGTSVTEFQGTTSLEALKVRDSAGLSFKIDASMCLVAIGSKPQSDLVAHLVMCAADGSIIMPDRSQATTYKGIFAAGDVCEGSYGQSFTAAADGMRAAYDAAHYIQALHAT